MNKQERTYTILRDRIHTGEYQPLDRLNIDALAREFGVSQIPVREALRRLEAEGWVQFRPNAGAVVAPVDTTSWEQAMVALAVLEGAATADARNRLRKTDIAKLRRIAAQMERALDDPLKFSTLNRQFHEVIVERCTNEVLRDLLAQTHRRLDQVRRTMFVYLPERSKAAVGSTCASSTCWRTARPSRSRATRGGTRCRPSRRTAPSTGAPDPLAFGPRPCHIREHLHRKIYDPDRRQRVGRGQCDPRRAPGQGGGGPPELPVPRRPTRPRPRARLVLPEAVDLVVRQRNRRAAEGDRTARLRG
ncbi:hypothetical protein GCM10029964_051120 [Kibdelosporangium lantanae]